jgi:outer membrane protein, heavy metal efflux system
MIRLMLFAFLVEAFFLTVPSRAQQGVSLDALVRQALERSPKLHASRARASAARAKIRQATAWDDPQFSFEFYQTPVSSFNPLKDNMENDYSVQQMIPFPGKKSLMGDMASWNAKMSDASVEAIRRDLVAEVTSAYAMLLSVQNRIRINGEIVRTIDGIIATAGARYSVGLGAQPALLMVQVEKEKALLEQTKLEQEWHSGTAMINALRAMPQDTPVGELEAPPLLPPPDAIGDLVASALAARPELAGMAAEIEMHRADAALQRRERLPDFMIRGMYKQMLMDGPDYWALMVGINVPIAPWSSGKYSGRIEEAESYALAAEHGYRDMANMVEYEVRDAWRKAASLWSQLRGYREAILPAADQACRSSLAQIQTSTADLRSALDAVRMLQMTRMEQAMLEADYLVAMARLRRAIGIDTDPDVAVPHD